MAIKYLAGNKLYGTTSERTGLTSSLGSANAGLTFIESGQDDMYHWDGDSWELIAGNSAEETLSSKTLVSPILTTPQINDSASDHQYIFAVGNLAADRTVTLPVLTATDTFTFNQFAATFHNKTIVHGSNGNSITGIGDGSIATGAISVNRLASSSVTIGSGTATLGGSALTALVALTDIDMTAANHVIFDGVGTNTLTLGASGTTIAIPGDLTVSGDLVVSGALTNVSTTQITIEDPLLALANENTSANTVDIGFYGTYNDGSTRYAGLFRDASDGKFHFFYNTTTTPTTVINPSAGGYQKATLVLGTLEATTINAFTLGGKLTAGAVEIEGTAFDINGGTIDGADVTVGSGKTLDVSAGTLTTSAAQKLAIVAGVGANTDIGAYDFRAATLTADGLTATRVVFAGANGVLSDDGDLTFATDTLTATKTKTTLVDSGGNTGLTFGATGSAVNHFTITNAASSNSPKIAANGSASNLNAIISGKGTGGIEIGADGNTGAYIEFGVKTTDASKPAAAGAEKARLFLKEVDGNNNALVASIQKAGNVVEVEITSPKAVCAVCGSKDGASDPTYDFEKGIMILDLWCGHSFEVPMQWSHINGS